MSRSKSRRAPVFVGAQAVREALSRRETLRRGAKVVLSACVLYVSPLTGVWYASRAGGGWSSTGDVWGDGAPSSATAALFFTSRQVEELSALVALGILTKDDLAAFVVEWTRERDGADRALDYMRCKSLAEKLGLKLVVKETGEEPIPLSTESMASIRGMMRRARQIVKETSTLARSARPSSDRRPRETGGEEGSERAGRASRPGTGTRSPSKARRGR